MPWLIRRAIEGGRPAGIPVGFCERAPLNDPDFARLPVGAGIGAISVTPDSFPTVKEHAEADMA